MMKRMVGVAIVCVFLFCIGCGTMQHMPPVSRDWNKEEVIRTLERMRNSHIRNRGIKNSPKFDDWCVENYDCIIEWAGKQEGDNE